MAFAVTAVGVTKTYGKKGGAVTACDGIDFEAHAGQVTGLLGPNGAGKTTLLKMLSGILAPTAGSITSCGTQDSACIRRQTGFVDEVPQLEPRLTVAETLFLECQLRSVPRQQIAQRVQAAVRAVQAQDVLDKRIPSLSRGFMQRVSLARALCFAPKVLVLDEFSGGLDPAQIVSIRRVIQRESKDKPVIFSTHHIDEALSLCTRLYILSHGRVVASGTPDAITAAAHKQTLEQAFLYLTGAAE